MKRYFRGRVRAAAPSGCWLIGCHKNSSSSMIQGWATGIMGHTWTVTKSSDVDTSADSLKRLQCVAMHFNPCALST